jgi:hypothetical protein
MAEPKESDHYKHGAFITGWVVCDSMIDSYVISSNITGGCMDIRVVLFLVSCNQDQLVMVRAGPELENFFQSIKCFWCGARFKARVPEMVIGRSHPFEEYSHF